MPAHSAQRLARSALEATETGVVATLGDDPCRQAVGRRLLRSAASLVDDRVSQAPGDLQARELPVDSGRVGAIDQVGVSSQVDPDPDPSKCDLRSPTLGDPAGGVKRDRLPADVSGSGIEAVCAEHLNRGVGAVDLEARTPIGRLGQPNIVKDAAGEEQLPIEVTARNKAPLAGGNGREQAAAHAVL